MVDVTIRGAGVFGLTIAWVCAQRGASVRVIDPNGVANGSSGGIVGALAPHVPENWNTKKAFQFDALLMAKNFWAEVDEYSGKSSGYGRTGRLQPLFDARAVRLAREREISSKNLWKHHATWEVIENTKDMHSLNSPTGLLIHDTLSARIHPQKACESLAAALVAIGVEITTDGPDEGRVCHATGWRGLTELSERFGRPIGNGVKGQAALLDFSVPGPQLFSEGTHIIGHADGTTAIGSTSERSFDDANTTDAQLDELVEKARVIFPALAKARVLKRWAGVRPRAMTRAPLIGRDPMTKGHFIANGGFKIGLGMAPKIAVVMADLILEHQASIPEEFDSEVQI